jgi:hypothetical protein
MPLPLFLHRVNIIHITKVGGIDETNLSTLVCNGFDLEQCCISLAIDDELNYMFYPIGDAFTCAEKRILKLRETAFAIQPSQMPLQRVISQLWRIIKYASRDFSWDSTKLAMPPATVRSLDGSQNEGGARGPDSSRSSGETQIRNIRCPGCEQKLKAVRCGGACTICTRRVPRSTIGYRCRPCVGFLCCDCVSSEGCVAEDMISET